MKKTAVVLLVLLMFVFACSCSGKKEKVVEEPERIGSETVLVSSKRNVIYAYTLQDVVWPDQYTAIVISFLDTFPDGRVNEKTFPHLKDTLEKFREEHPYTKVIAGLGGASNSERLGEVIMDDAKRKVLAETTASLLNSRGIDGVDLDWELIREARAEDEGTYLLRTNLPDGDP